MPLSLSLGALPGGTERRNFDHPYKHGAQAIQFDKDHTCRSSQCDPSLSLMKWSFVVATWERATEVAFSIQGFARF
jgi:hypothetical protein